MRRLSLIAILGLGLSSSVLAKSLVILDPGHPSSPLDKGTTWGGYTEMEETLKIAEAVMAILDGEPDIVGTLTRGTNTYDAATCPISKRAAFTRNTINQGSATYDTFIFLSIHLNASIGTSATGVETFFLEGSSLASEPHEFSFYTQYQQVISRRLVRNEKGQGDRGLRDGKVYQPNRMGLLKELAKYDPKPNHSALIEVAFLHSDDFLKSISENPNFIQEIIAPAIISAIKDILKSNRKPVAAINIRPPSPIDPSIKHQMEVRLTTSKKLTSSPTLEYTPSGATPIKLWLTDIGAGVTSIRRIIWQATTNIATSTPRGTASFSYLGTDTGGVSDTTIMVGSSFLFTSSVVSTTEEGTPTFVRGSPVYIKGEGYAAKTDYNVYITPDRTWLDGMAISPSILSSVITTNSQGEIATGTAIPNLRDTSYWKL